VTFDYLVSRALEEHLMVLENSVCRGAPSDFSAYCSLVGEIRGIRFALSQLTEARRRVNEDEDEDDRV
jgi:hypothetical protein